MTWLLLTSMASAATIVVDASGAGDTTDLGAAIASAADGDRIEVRAGLYAIADVDLRQSIDIIGAGSDLVLITDGGADYSLLGIYSDADVYVEGIRFLDLRGWSLTAVSATSSGTMSFSDVVFDGFYLGIWVHTSGWLDFDRCVFASNNVTMQYFGLGNTRIANSVFIDNEWGSYPYWEPGATSLELFHNTFVANGTDFLFEDAYSYHGTDTITVYDNIFASDNAGLFMAADPYPIVDVANNLYYPLPTSGSPVVGTDAIEADPLFVDFSDDGDWTNDDLRLQPGSPAIDMAVSGEVSEDRDGIPRPLDGDGDGVAAADLGAFEWYADDDGDGYIDAGIGGDDCDDGDATVNPGELELAYDGLDNDCDPSTPDDDLDEDGWELADDCDDGDASINPDAIEVWYDGVDGDCDGASDYDADSDGFDSDAFGGDDCDDRDASITPGATEVWYDGVDGDCDGADDFDQDGDGFALDDDCDDEDAAIYPGADGWTEGCEPVVEDTGSPDDKEPDPGPWGCHTASGARPRPPIASLLCLLPLLVRRRNGRP